MLVEIWSDVVCPWCYIGKRRFESALSRFEHADEVGVRWRSFELDPNAPRRFSGSMAEHLASKYGMTVEHAQQRLEDMNRLAAVEGLRYDLAHTRGGNTMDAHRLIHLGYAKNSETGSAVKEAMLKAYFVDLEAIGAPEVLTEAAVSAGLEREEVAAVLASDRFAEDVRRDEAEAVALGSSGVPFFVFDRALAVPGAQDSETLLITMRRAWERSHPPSETVKTVLGAGGAACEGDSCPV